MNGIAQNLPGKQPEVCSVLGTDPNGSEVAKASIKGSGITYVQALRASTDDEGLFLLPR
jgi:hypothetical protein